MSDDEKHHFREFVSSLESAEGEGPVPWPKLYPTDNVAAATLLALLTAGKVSDITQPIQKMLNERRQESLARAHRQFAARAQRSSGAPPPTLEAWIAALDRNDYSSVRNQLTEVLGAVPD